MKRILLLSVFALAAITSFSQDLTKPRGVGNYHRVSLVSPGGDTLYLSDDDFGRLISQCWTADVKEPRPIIVFVSTEKLQVMSVMRRYKVAWKRHERKRESRYEKKRA